MPPRRAEGVTAEGFRALQRQIEALQEQMRRGMNLTVRDESEDEREEGQVDQEEQQEEEVLNPEEEKLFKALTKIGKRPKFEVPTFLGKLNPEELIDWINELEDCFECEEIEDLDRVKFVKAKLKGHTKI